jgi:hypothetical protein
MTSKRRANDGNRSLVLRKPRRPILVLLCLSLIPLAGVTTCGQTSRPRDDAQIWTDVQLGVTLNKTIDFVLLGLVRFGRNVKRPVNERIGAGVSFKAGKYLTFFPFVLYVASQPTSTDHSKEERITLEATARFPLRRFSLSDRNRVEFHIHNPRPDFTQYRNRLQLEHPLTIGGVRLNGFLADEVFYDSIARAWIRNRIFVGIEKKVNKHFTCVLYYVRQNDSHSHPGDIHAIGTSFKFHL